MPGYSTRKLSLTLGGDVWQLRVLSDLQQFTDPDGHGERPGIPDAHARVVLTDPGRGHSANFSRLPRAQAVSLRELRCALDDEDSPPYRGRLLQYERVAAGRRAKNRRNARRSAMCVTLPLTETEVP